MRGEKKINYSICLLRIVACLFIVWNHTSAYMLNNALNKILWANIGVQIFFFMSGYLYSTKEINKPINWFKSNALKIMKPYWIYLVLIIPVIYVLDASRITIKNVVASFAGIQGFGEGFQIMSLGQHWFISYILLCYLITPVIIPKIYEKFGGGYRVLLAMAFSQVITIPFAVLFNFKVAYIWTYICGYIYGRKYQTTVKNEVEKKRTDRCYYLIAIIGLIVRLILDEVELSGMLGSIASLCIQWIKLFQGGAIFICTLNLITPEKWAGVKENVKKVIYKLSKFSFEIYIVHEFFVHDIFTQFIPFNGIWKVIIAWMFMVIATVLLVLLEKIFQNRRRTIEKSRILG